MVFKLCQRHFLEIDQPISYSMESAKKNLQDRDRGNNELVHFILEAHKIALSYSMEREKESGIGMF